jgi:hypothetical protein
MMSHFFSPQPRWPLGGRAPAHKLKETRPRPGLAPRPAADRTFPGGWAEGQECHA